MEKKIFVKSQAETKEIQDRVVLRKLLLQQVYKHHFQGNEDRFSVNIQGDVEQCRNVFLAYSVLRELGYLNYAVNVHDPIQGNLIIFPVITVKGILEYENL